MRVPRGAWSAGSKWVDGGRIFPGLSSLEDPRDLCKRAHRGGDRLRKRRPALASLLAVRCGGQSERMGPCSCRCLQGADGCGRVAGLPLPDKKTGEEFQARGQSRQASVLEAKGTSERHGTAVSFACKRGHFARAGPDQRLHLSSGIAKPQAIAENSLECGTIIRPHTVDQIS